MYSIYVMTRFIFLKLIFAKIFLLLLLILFSDITYVIFRVSKVIIISFLWVVFLSGSLMVGRSISKHILFVSRIFFALIEPWAFGFMGYWERTSTVPQNCLLSSSHNFPTWLLPFLALKGEFLEGNR